MHSESHPHIHCSHCGYDLTGIPEQHRCPECGEQFDRLAIVAGNAARVADRKLLTYQRAIAFSVLGLPMAFLEGELARIVALALVLVVYPPVLTLLYIDERGWRAGLPFLALLPFVPLVTVNHGPRALATLMALWSISHLCRGLVGVKYAELSLVGSVRKRLAIHRRAACVALGGLLLCLVIAWR